MSRQIIENVEFKLFDKHPYLKEMTSLCDLFHYAKARKLKLVLIVDDLDKLDKERFGFAMASIQVFMQTEMFSKLIFSTVLDEINRLRTGPEFSFMGTVKIVPLLPLTVDETRSFILFYLEKVRTKHTKSLVPFTNDAVVEIWRRTNGDPREILRICGLLLSLTVREGKGVVDSASVRRVPA